MHAHERKTLKSHHVAFRRKVRFAAASICLMPDRLLRSASLSMSIGIGRGEQGLMQIFNGRVKTFAIVVLAATALPGCTTRSIDCTLGAPHADCAKDTLGHEAAQDIQRAGQATAAIDDARCRSYGFSPGSPNYSRCRSDIDRQRTTPVR